MSEDIKHELSTLPEEIVKASKEKDFLKTMPSYSAWLAEAKDNLRYGDNSSSATAIRRSNGGMRTVDHLWNQVIAEAKEAKAARG